MASQARYEDVIGQFPILKTYNHGLLLFPIADDSARESVVKALEEGTAEVVSKIPWLADQVVDEGKDHGKSGPYKLAPWPKDAQPNRIVRVKDCSNVCPSYADLIKAGAPVSKLDASVLCPFPGFPQSYDESVIGPAPVVAIQANFVKGGLLLNFSNQHNFMDATGLFMFIMHLATAMRGEELSDIAIQQGNRDPKTVIPLFPEGEPIRDHSHLIRPAPANGTPAAPPPAALRSPASWCYFRLFGSAIPKIKALASDPATLNPNVPFISSNDALSAFYWKRLAAVRLRNGRPASATSKLGRAIDARAAVGVPPEYLGQMVYHAATRLSLGELAALPLAVLASRVRADLNEANTPFAVRSYATFVAGVPDRSTLAYGGPFDTSLDVGSSSMAQLPALPRLGALGEPDLIRRPNLAPVPGGMYLYPAEKGDLPVLVCLSEEDLDGLKKDPEWSMCTEVIG